ncbi:MAG: ABC transporter substrate-binding protein, partial [Actinobacteria bacterium]|nr:ABC transporter substrate-binding protein [Actinomycetota bacterium]
MEEYSSALVGSANEFLQMVPNICLRKPDVVYFAGRSKELKDFLVELAKNPCEGAVTVLTGDDASLLQADGN